jgi:hypothetical protein
MLGRKTEEELIDYLRWNPNSGLSYLAQIIQAAADKADNECDPGYETILQEAANHLKVYCDSLN